MNPDHWSKPEPRSPGGTNLTEDPSLTCHEENKEVVPAPHLPSPRYEEANSELMFMNMNHFLSNQAQLPQYKLQVPFNITCSKIGEVFQRTSKSRNFQVIEHSSNIATAVHKDKMRLKELLMCCLSNQSAGEKVVSAVRLHIGVNEKKCKRTILVKGIYGAAGTVLEFLNAFKTNMESVVNSQPVKVIRHQSHYSEVQYEPLSSDKFPEDEDGSLTIKNESASYYQFHKILSSESYTLGKTISMFVSSFLAQYRNPVESAALLPQPVSATQMESVKQIIEDTVEALFSHFNFGKASAEKMMQFCRPAVEKFVFSKVYAQLLEMYQEKFKQIDLDFAERQRRLKTVPEDKLLDALEVISMQVKAKYRLGPQPYQESVDILGKLQDQSTPVEKLNCLVMATAALKTAVVEHWKGKEELEAMDDLLPVLIFVLVRCSITVPATHINMLQDYVSHTSRYESESRLLTNFEVSIKYIAYEWPISAESA